MSHNIYFLLLIFFVSFKPFSCERLHEQIYSSIEGAGCFKRLNGTHQAGCSSSNTGDVGVVQMINDVSDAQWLAHNASGGPYMAVVSTALFHDVIELLMTKSANTAGILIYNNITMRPTTFSQESRCPNKYSSDFNSQCPSKDSKLAWNEGGTGLLRRDIPFPIFYLPEYRMEDVTKIKSCYERYNLDKINQDGKPLCSIQLNSFMFAAVNSAVCLRRSASSALLTSTKVCDPLGDQNVYYSLFPRKKGEKVKPKSTILVTARIDTASLFDGIAPGAASSVIGMVSLLISAITLSAMIPSTDYSLYEKNVMWALFNGEAFDYIGSQRVAYDLKSGNWPHVPMAVSDIKLHVEIGQLGGALNLYPNSSWPIHAFAAPDAAINTPMTEFLNNMLATANAYNITLSPVFTSDLPPSSLHSFRRILKNETESGELPEFLLVDHKETFTNAYYESVLDDTKNVGFVYKNVSVPAGIFVPTNVLIMLKKMKPSDIQVKIARLATAVSWALYQEVTGKPYVGKIAASAHMVDEMLYCFLRSQACPMLVAADFETGSDEKPSPYAPSLYVGVTTWPSTPAVFAGHLLALLAGDRLTVNRSTCNAMANPGYSYYWLRGWHNKGACMQTTMNFTQALSPAFVIPGYNMTSGEYSTWTESVWSAMWARVFVQPGGGGWKAAALSGAVSTALTAVLSYFVQRHVDRLFGPLIDAIPVEPTEAATTVIRTVNC